MSRNVRLYRPQRTEPEFLEATSVGREPLLQEILERLERWKPGASRQHYLLIGPRGIGKTHLLRLVEHRVETNAGLKNRWMPIVMPEEFYSVTRISDLLLEILRLLSEERGLPAVAEVYQSVRYDEDDARVNDRCLDILRQLHRETGRALLLMVENLDRILERQIRTRAEIHKLRRIFLEEEWLVTICTSPTYLNAVASPEEPFFEFFQVHSLAELTAVEQEEMLHKLAIVENNTAFGEYLSQFRSRLRALYHFTGGNPRLAVMLYDLVAHKKVGAVRSELDLLLDQLTPFYQDRMKEISEQEAKILEVMALLPEGCSPKELAREARIAAGKVRAVLTRLERAGYVRREERRRKRTVYIVPERFFRIWHQMNHSRADRGRVQYLLEFFSSWYASREERDIIWDELAVDFEQRIDDGDIEGLADVAEFMGYVIAVSEGAEQFERIFERLQRIAEAGFKDKVEQELKELDAEHRADGDYFFYKGYFLGNKLGRHEAGLEAFLAAIELKRDDLNAHYNRAVALEKVGRFHQAQLAFEETAGQLIRGLGFKNASVQSGLIRVLRTEMDSRLVWMASGLLGRLADQSVQGEIIAILRSSDAPWRRRCCANVLAHLGADLAVPGLLNLLQDPAVEIRESDTSPLGHMGSSRAVHSLACVLNDRDEEVRSAAAAALGRIESPDAIALLIRVLVDQDPGVRRSAATALGRLGSPGSDQPLVHALDDSDRNVRSSAATALGRIRSLGAVQPLIRALKDPEDRVRSSAANALGSIGSSESVSALIDALDDSASNVRSSAAIALGRLSDSLTGGDLQRVTHFFLHDPSNPISLFRPSTLQLLLNTVFRKADLGLIKRVISEVASIRNDREIWAVHEIALDYLSSDRDPGILERQQPEMREAVLLLVGLFDEGSAGGSDGNRREYPER